MSSNREPDFKSHLPASHVPACSVVNKARSRTIMYEHMNDEDEPTENNKKVSKRTSREGVNSQQVWGWGFHEWSPIISRGRLNTAAWPAAGASGQKGALVSIHRLPNGVRTNVFFAEVPQYTIIMT